MSTPLIGEETIARNPAPQPVRVKLAEESVEGWLVPLEKILRFPVELKQDYRLSFRLGVVAEPYDPMVSEMPSPDMMGLNAGNGQSPALPPGSPPPLPQPPSSFTAGPPAVLPTPEEVILRVEFASTGPDGKPEGEPTVLYEISAEEFTESTQDWFLVDLPLDDTAPARGELRLVADGPKAGSQDFQVLWGQPTLYFPHEGPYRNVLLIGVDTLRADAISPLGGRPEVTPNIQAFSENATVFTQAYSQAPWTLPSFASIVTGLMPATAIDSEMGQYLPRKVTTVGELLLPEGFATYTVCSSPWLGNPRSGFEQGMEGFSLITGPIAQVQVEDAMKFIAMSDDLSRDWFCFIHLMDPHTPYSPPEHLIDLLCDSDYTGEYPTSYPGSRWRKGDIIPSQEEIEHERCLYDCEVANVDSALKDLFDFLDERGLTEDTLIIFCSDHGEEFNEHGGFEHGETQYEEQVHVPLIIKGPGFPAGERFDNCVANLDILPTILRFLGITQPESVSGIPLQDILSGERANNRVIFGEEALDNSGLIYSLIWPYKCILDYKTEESQLFDLANDPGETTDLSDELPEEKAAMVATLQMMLRPESSEIHVWVTGYEQYDHRFTGSIHVPGGVGQVQTYLFDSGDTYTVSGDTVNFNISSLINQPLGPDNLRPRGVTFIPMPMKHLMITPSPDVDMVEFSVTVDGEISGSRFFPFGNSTVNSSGSVSVGIDEFPMVPLLPTPGESPPDSIILWGARGTQSDEPPIELDPETLEQLRALGYLN